MKRALWATVLLAAACGGSKRADEPAATIAFVGDILLDSTPGRDLAEGRDPFGPTSSLLGRADLRVGNLECPVATSGTAVDKVYTFRAAPTTLRALHRSIDAVSVANNHSGDYGPAAFRETLEQLSAAAIPYFGGGLDLARAHRPLLLERHGIKLALLGYDEYHPRSFEAKPDAAGVAWAEEEQVALDILAARRAGADVVLPFFHWGWENEPAPSEHQRELARRFIDAGADAVIGAHPHVTQGAEMYRGRPIIYSLGNFVFDLLDKPENAAGWVLELVVDRHGVVRFTTHPIHIDERGTPWPVAGAGLCATRGDRAVAPCARASSPPPVPTAQGQASGGAR